MNQKDKIRKKITEKQILSWISDETQLEIAIPCEVIIPKYSI